MLKETSSFRDPSGFIFEYQGEIYRYVTTHYARDYTVLTQSGLLDKLFDSELLIRHSNVELDGINYPNLLTILKPERVPLITYPYEWSFLQLKDAALLTLEILQQSLKYNMILKDASAFNVQYLGYKPVFIDTLSFTIYEDGQPWLGYKQFCEHFLGPLCLSSYLGVSFQSLLRLGVDGIPLKFVSKMLPARSWLRSAVLLHIHLHAKFSDYYSYTKRESKKKEVRGISKRNLLAMVDNLKKIINRLKLPSDDKTQWQDYDKQLHYSDRSKQEKVRIVNDLVSSIDPKIIWDIGSNEGFYSRAISEKNRQVVSLDSDPIAIDKNYKRCKVAKNPYVQPLIFDVANPSPDLGWNNNERLKLSRRSNPDLIMALAVIHHLVISNNVPFAKVAEYFSELADWLIIEFVPKNDEKIVPLPDNAWKSLYTRENFDEGFLKYFLLIKEYGIEGSQRSILLYKKR